MGEYCRLTNNCLGEDTVCRSGVCECPINTHLNKASGECVANLNLGDKCKQDVECFLENARCHDVCRCQVSHIISSDNHQCLKIADSISNECEEDSQCQVHIPNSVCGKSRTCECREGYHENSFVSNILISNFLKNANVIIKIFQNFRNAM